MAARRPFDLVVFGASGFTGQFVVEEVVRVASEAAQLRPLTWAVAGRSRGRLQEVLERLSSRLGNTDLKSDVSIIICDVNDPSSLAAMCQQGTVILSCVGPYRLFGEPVVKACVENGAHYVDICGEPQFLEAMQQKYNDQAAEQGVYVVGSCGFDSIPADMGVLYTRNQLKGNVTYVSNLIGSGPEYGGCGHATTWQSAVYGFSDRDSLRKLRRQFGHKPLPFVGTKIRSRGSVFYSNEVNQYAVPFIGSDPAVVKRTQRYLYENFDEQPVQYGSYVAVGGISSVVALMMVGFFFWCFTKFSFGRKLLIKYPEFFSFGMFSKEGPTIKQMEGTTFSMRFYGVGYGPDQDPLQSKPNVKIFTEVKGPEPGYVTTPKAMVQAAVTMLWETKSLPGRGGVFSPGAAFSKTSLIERLNKHSIEFSVISHSEA
uniref:Saccharopine dehydrogenase-like oxidoreductase n=1 Tax=Callorhinchus milii TaxID=7868 RepID=A0A4W3K580_CALMI